MTSLHLVYGDSEQEAVDRLLEEFGSRARELGVTVRAAPSHDS